MKFRCLRTGSKGNCYLLESDTECLVVEAGLPFKEVKKALNFNISKIVGVIASHSHNDHSKHTQEYINNGIPTFQPYLSEMERQVRTYGNFVIRAFSLVHDVPCFGFYIEHPRIGKCVYITDTELVSQRFVNQKLDAIFIEANYDKNLIDDNAANRSHVFTGHLEINTTVEFLRVNDNPNLKNVVLLHLSDSNSNEEDFRRRAQEVVKSGVLYVADKGMEIEV